MNGKDWLRLLIAAAPIVAPASHAFAVRAPRLDPPGAPGCPLLLPAAPGGMHHREMGPSEEHRWVVRLDRGQLLDAVVMQEGIDLVLQVVDRAGNELARVDTPNGMSGPEKVFTVAERPGDHEIVVRTFLAEPRRGAYTLTISPPRPATHRDRLLAEGAALAGWGWELRNEFRWGEARPIAEKALRVRRAALGPLHADVAASLDLLGYIADEQAEYEKAVRYFEEAVAIREKPGPAEDPDLLRTRSDLGWVRLAAGDLDGAEAAFRWVAEARERIDPPDSPRLDGVRLSLAAVARRRGRLDEAAERMRALIAARLVTGGAEAVAVATARETLGHVLLEAGQPRAAEEEFRKALARLERGPERPSWDRVSLASAHLGLGRALIAEGDLEAARPHLDRALEIQRSLRPKDHPAIGEPLAALADLERRQGLIAEARRHLSEADVLLGRYPDGHPARRLADDVRLALQEAPTSRGAGG